MADVQRGNGYEIRWYTNAIVTEITAEVGRRLRAAGDYLARRIRDNISSPRRSGVGEYPGMSRGQLANSIYTAITGLIVRIGSNAPHAMYLEMGTRGGKTIYAKPGTVFSWIGDDGQRVFSKKVTLGAIRGRSFIRRTFNAELRAMDNIIGGGAGVVV